MRPRRERPVGGLLSEDELQAVAMFPEEPIRQIEDRMLTIARGLSRAQVNALRGATGAYGTTATWRVLGSYGLADEDRELTIRGKAVARVLPWR